MGVDPRRVELEVVVDDGHSELVENLPLAYSSNSDAGHYKLRDGHAVITVDGPLARHPLILIATMSHELCHERLIGEGRISPSRRDEEPLTDLLTVFLGMGIFNANASLETSQGSGEYSSRRLGYLTEPMFGYALACYAWLRGDEDPPWASHVDANPRSFLKRGLRYLRSTAPLGTLPAA